MWMFIMTLGDARIALYPLIFNGPSGALYTIFVAIIGMIAWSGLCFSVWVFTGMYVHDRWVAKEVKQK